ncbi:Hypothetical predicted protein [Mytilus galloprovincialis]|uniref:SGNH hydrolase-type esterase domain-containing protein n=1 Tax=Mytilus galloprovincialis TaxID=29158 RepID=A0A8B6CV19_MYTGA|nr:Hypothetical predicted protein [Mytilus galloprovincialis]
MTLVQELYGMTMTVDRKYFKSLTKKNKFTNKQPHKDLFKSTVSVSVGKQKQFVVTLFYTAKTGMVQGQTSYTLLQSDFKSINEVINTIIELQKKENNNYDVDKLFGEIQSNMRIINQIRKRDETKRDESEETQGRQNGKKSTQLEQQNRQLALDVRQENNINNAKNIKKLNGIEKEIKEKCVKSKKISENSTSDQIITETEQLVADQTEHVATRNSNNKPLTNIGSKTNDENNTINNNTKHSPTASNSSSSEQIKNERKDKTDVLIMIIGSSIIKDLDAKKMYQYKGVKVTTLHDKTVFGATNFIASGKVKAKNIVFQIGSNDIEERQTEQVIMDIENLIQQTKECAPEATITFGECLPRIYRDKLHTKEFNERGHILNLELSELCKETNCHFIKYDYISPDHFRDGIHLKGYGIAILVSTCSI